MRFVAASVILFARASLSLGQTCPLPPPECAGTLHCGGEWDFEAGFYATPHYLAGQCAGPPGGGAISCVPADKASYVGIGWTHWASFPTWSTAGYWGTVAFNENKNCANVYRSNRSQELTMTCANGVGVIYKQAAVPLDHRIRVEAQMKFTPNGPAPDVEHALGVDPTGGTNPTSAAIKWTIWNQPVAGVFNLASVEAVSTGPVMTVLIRQRAFEPPCEGQTFMIDTVRVFDLGPTGPIIDVAPTLLEAACIVETDAEPQSIAIRNAGTATLAYNVGTLPSWIMVTPDSGTATTETDTLLLSFDTDGLPAGRHETTFAVTAQGAMNSPVTISVGLNISDKPGDLDGDRDVDQADFGLFQRCLSGPNIGQSEPSCRGAKLDGDTDVDVDDFGLFQRCFSGPGVSSNPHCLHVP